MTMRLILTGAVDARDCEQQNNADGLDDQSNNHHHVFIITVKLRNNFNMTGNNFSNLCQCLNGRHHHHP